MLDAEQNWRDEELAAFADRLLDGEVGEQDWSDDDALRELQELVVAARDIFAEGPDDAFARRVHGRLISEWVSGGYDRREVATPIVTRVIGQISRTISRGSRQRRTVVSLAGIVVLILIAAAFFVDTNGGQAGAALGGPIMIGIALVLVVIVGVMLFLSRRR